MSPDTWTTLPEDYEADDWMFDVTDPDDLVDPVSAALFTLFKAHGYDRVEVAVNGERRSRYTVRKEDLEDFLSDIRTRRSEHC